MQSSTPRGEFVAGVRDTFPLIVGAIPFGIIFGALAASNDVSLWVTLGMSLFVFAGSSQFIAVGLLAQGTGTALIILATFIVNVRHALYSATLAPYLQNLPHKWLIALGFWLTDETFAVTITRYQREDTPNKHWYQLGSSVAMYSNWFACTVAGALVGQLITPQQAAALGFEFAMIVTFIGLVVPMVKSRPMLAAVVVAAVVATATNGLPHKMGLMVGALSGIAAGVWFEGQLQRARGVFPAGAPTPPEANV